MSAKDSLCERYTDKIIGVLGCYDRLVLSGTLTAIAFPEAMAAKLGVARDIACGGLHGGLPTHDLFDDAREETDIRS